MPSEDTLTPPARAWTQVSPERGTKLEESKIRALWSTVSGLRAKAVTDPASRAKFGLDKPKYSLAVADSLGRRVRIEFSDPVNEEEDRYLVVEGRAAVYGIDKSSFERVFVKPFESAK